MDDAVVGRLVAGVAVEVGRVGGLLRPPVARVPAPAAAEVLDAAGVPAVPARRAVAAGAATLVRLVSGEVDATLAWVGDSGETGVDSLEERATSEPCDTSTVSLSAMMDDQRSGLTVSISCR